MTAFSERSQRSILIPLDSFYRLIPADREYLWELMLGEETDWSPRERLRVEAAIERGDLWLALHEQREDRFVISLSMESPDNVLRVEFPSYVSLRLAVECVANVFDKISA